MKNLIYCLLFITVAGCSGGLKKNSETVRIYEKNPRYIEYKGKPIVLITSAEHYGAVLNLDFDYSTYLKSLADGGFNYTRIFTGTYIEPVENIFGIQKNTLAPLPGRFISPWQMKEGRYDLSRFNPQYFERLKSFLSEAESLGILVEITLFTSIYAEGAWKLSPFFEGNNINRTGDLPFKRVNTLYNGKLLNYQEAYVRKMVRELNAFDNIFFEIQNEPWSDNQNLAAFVNESDDNLHSRAWQKEVVIANEISMEWQAWVVSLIKEEEESLPKSHMIAQNISNFQYDLEALPDNISIVNFHYALPGAVQMNLDLGAVIGLDETGFMPHDEALYLDQAWRVVLSGAGLYNNLDYSFTADNEGGDWPIPDSNPGWGGPQFRAKLSILVETMNKIPFWEMDFDDSILDSEGASFKQYGLKKEDKLCLLFLEHYNDEALIPILPEGEYEVSYINVNTGESRTETCSLGKGEELHSPYEDKRMAILIKKLN